jgi:uncharacterized protein YdeI (BOF family)
VITADYDLATQETTMMSRQVTKPTAYWSRMTSLAALSAVLVAVAFAAGCGEEEKQGPPSPHQFKLEVSVIDEGENAVPRAPVLLDGNIVGYTDREGLFQAVLTEQLGTEVQVSVGDMNDYHVPEEARANETLSLKPALDGTKRPVEVILKATVHSARKNYLVWVEAECDKYLDDKCEDLPVVVDGEVVAHTDDTGKAHFQFEGVPDDTVTVEIDTPKFDPSVHGEDAVFVMEPEKPSYEVSLGLNPELLVIKEQFSDSKAAERAAEEKKKRRRRRLRRLRRQRAKKASSKPSKPKKEEKDDGVIDLW